MSQYVVQYHINKVGLSNTDDRVFFTIPTTGFFVQKLDTATQKTNVNESLAQDTKQKRVLNFYIPTFTLLFIYVTLLVMHACILLPPPRKLCFCLDVSVGWFPVSRNSHKIMDKF